jgi:hypothetical protein
MKECVIMPLFSLPVACCLFWGCWEKIEVGLAFWSEQFSVVNLYNRRWEQFMHTCLKLLSLAM